MGLGKFTEGWDFPEDDDNGQNGGGSSGGGGGGGGGDTPRKTWGFFIPRPKDYSNPFKPKSCVKRVLFISDMPVHMWLHPLYNVKGAGDLREVLCLRKNGLDNRGCPTCKKKVKLQYVGYFTVIDMGFVERQGTEVRLLPTYGKEDERGDRKAYQFQKRVLCAKKGGSDKPGVLITLKRKMEQYGLSGLYGTVWDICREGGKTEAVGNDWTHVGTLREDQIEKYLLKWGANMEHVDLDPVDWREHFDDTPSYEDLELKFFGSSGQQQSSGTRTEGAGWNDKEGSQQGQQQNLGDQNGPPDDSGAPPPDDDDIPF